MRAQQVAQQITNASSHCPLLQTLYLLIPSQKPLKAVLGKCLRSAYMPSLSLGSSSVTSTLR
ncbi:hypothetical protein BAUCODRAFT_36031 [Baudoinia panamericana UAMH 10762]|uniref:Uncharacterized protein n=1 Tax=Baudoinia panamericana (strain UAMH 10762) TaxID=717646 RepID=M2MTB1_BAUPA|nr:uncharacterized protein BAUCODRAFT_36031 [Baudoinia panamericana UAMH 10762]EMC94768.1 hypothetical protein BAUCODRAFT_36031 [Baudoinia panamericana UAMH 10762]